MRVLSTALLAAGLFVAPLMGNATTHKSHSKAPAVATPACQFPADRAAFDIVGLKSELMVTALACKQQDRYNEFMTRYQPAVAAEEHDLNSYFKRSYGRTAQKAYDDYISNLANIQEQDGLKAGTAFCENLAAMFSEVMSLHDSTELHDFANSKTIAQPVTFDMCTAPPPPPTRTARHSKGKHA